MISYLLLTTIFGGLDPSTAISTKEVSGGTDKSDKMIKRNEKRKDKTTRIKFFFQ